MSTSGNKGGGSNTASSPSSAATSTPAGAGVEVAAEDGKFEFVVQDVGGGVPSIGTDVIGTKAQGKFVLVTVKITNIGDQPQTFFGSNAKAFDNAGKQYAPDSTAAIYLPDSNSLLTPINPGNSVTGVVVFDVPMGSTLTSIELHDSAFSGGVTIGL